MKTLKLVFRTDRVFAQLSAAKWHRKTRPGSNPTREIRLQLTADRSFRGISLLTSEFDENSTYNEHRWDYARGYEYERSTQGTLPTYEGDPCECPGIQEFNRRHSYEGEWLLEFTEDFVLANVDKASKWVEFTVETNDSRTTAICRGVRSLPETSPGGDAEEKIQAAVAVLQQAPAEMLEKAVKNVLEEGPVAYSIDERFAISRTVSLADGDSLRIELPGGRVMVVDYSGGPVGRSMARIVFDRTDTRYCYEDGLPDVSDFETDEIFTFFPG